MCAHSLTEWQGLLELSLTAKNTQIIGWWKQYLYFIFKECYQRKRPASNEAVSSRFLKLLGGQRMQQLVEDELQRVLLLTSELIWARSIWAASFWARSIWSGSISAELTWYILPLPVWLILSSRSICLIWSIKSFWSTWLIWSLWTSRPIWLRLSLVIVFVSSHSPSLSEQI